MDPFETLPVRFHVHGWFEEDGPVVQYLGGTEVMSYIDMDKISYPEIVGHLKDHVTVPDCVKMHWLFPGAEMANGVTLLCDDKSCLTMSDSIVEGGVADIYVECPRVDEDELGSDDNISDFEKEVDPCDETDGKAKEEEAEEQEEAPRPAKSESREEAQRQIARLREFYSSPTKKGKEVVNSDSAAVLTQVSQAGVDEASLEEDEEALDILKKFKAFKRKMRNGEVAWLDGVVLGGSSAMPTGFSCLVVEGDTEYYETDDEGSDEIGSDGEFRRKASGGLRFNKTKMSHSSNWE
ncbi:hypothetical protein QOZ80_8AG0625470 [Eleusine coracana subsp. coracana]|nr:hypothetical protein QOZ80_8AG0625470 [Eleusine coracana subsp. coracana]